MGAGRPLGHRIVRAGNSVSGGVLAAVRMLLHTRGTDPEEEAEEVKGRCDLNRN